MPDPAGPAPTERRRPATASNVHDALVAPEVFLRALKGWADPTTQDAIRSLNQEIASGKPLATVPVDQVIAELRRRLAGNDA